LVIALREWLVVREVCDFELWLSTSSHANWFVSLLLPVSTWHVSD